MSSAHVQNSATYVAKPTSGKRFIFPLIVLIIGGALFAAPWVWDALGHEAVMQVSMLLYWAPMLTFVLLALWWFGFSGFSWATRLIVVLLLAIGAWGFISFCVRKVEMVTTDFALVPSFEFVWDATPEEKLAQYLQEHPSKNDGLPVIDATVGPEDFPAYRGAHRDGVVPFGQLRSGWGQYPPKVLWRHPCGGGYSGIAVAGNIAVTLEQRGKEEVVVCYDRATGTQRWIHAYKADWKDVMGDGPRSTPTIYNQRIFSVGATGDLVCLNIKGQRQWAINILEDSKATNIKWGLSGSPLIVDDLVVVHAGINPDNPADAAVVAYEQATGKKRWYAGNRKAGYSSPQLATLGGTQQILLFDGAGLVSYDPKTGAELWQSPWITAYEMNSIQPVVLNDNRVFISSETDNGCAMLRVQPPKDGKKTWSVETVWQNKNLAARFANPVSDSKHIYGLHHLPGVLRCLDADDGKLLWKGERYGPGQLLLDNDLLIVVSGDKGGVSLVAADPKAFRELDHLDVLDYLDSATFLRR